MRDNPMCDALPISCGHDAKYFIERHCSIDCRGPIAIDKDSYWGFYITVITLSHGTYNWDTQGFSSATVNRPVIVEHDAWIGSGALLYNCTIRHHAIVALGAVVRSQEVKPFVMVAGNPARVVARCVEGTWQYLTPKWEVLE